MKKLILTLGAVCALIEQLKSVVVLSGNSSGGSISKLVSNAINANGQLDLAFGNNAAHVLGTSYITSSICGAEGNKDQLNAMAVQADGKIVVGGTTQNNNTNFSAFALARFNPDGTLDTTFGGNGVGTKSLIPGTVYIDQSISGGINVSDSMSSNILAIDAAGNIVVAGQTIVSNDSYFAVARFTSDGMLDATFGVDGAYTKTFIPGTIYITASLSESTDSNDYVKSLALQSDGKIIVGGQTIFNNGAYYCAVARFTPEGALDDSFGVTGVGTASFFPGTVYINESICQGINTLDGIMSLALQANGKLVAAVQTNNNQGGIFFGVARFTPEGALDSSFGANGAATTSHIPGTVYINQSISGKVNPNDFVYALVLQTNGKLVLGGQTNNINNYLAVARFTTEGLLDSSFGATGVGTTSFFPGTVYINQGICERSQLNDILYSLTLQVDGKIVAGGETWDNSDDSYFVLARFTPEGLLDNGFGATGVGTKSLVPGTVYINTFISGVDTTSASNTIYSIAVGSNGNIVAGGITSTDDVNHRLFALAQFCNIPNFNSYQAAYTGVGAGLNA